MTQNDLPSSLEIMPSPFEWIQIPAGKVKLRNTWDEDEHVYLKKAQPQTFDVPYFSIAKYPLTNGQFAMFIEADAYNQRDFWTDIGWQAKVAEKWTEPRYWQEQRCNGIDFPVVGVGWHEAIAFCNWLSSVTGEKIMLPTEQQWQRAAQGDDRRAYPWGKWDAENCNHGIGKTERQRGTTPVTEYEGKGDSPFGVVDMSGNVYERCLTDYYTGSNDVNGTYDHCVRGGSGYHIYPYYFRNVHRLKDNPVGRWDNTGFRLARI